MPSNRNPPPENTTDPATTEPGEQDRTNQQLQDAPLTGGTTPNESTTTNPWIKNKV